MADNNLPPPVTPKKGRIRKPLKASDFATPAGYTVSSYTSFEGFIADPQTVAKYKTIDLQLGKLIPLDAFLLGLGVPEESLKAEDPSISSIASSGEVLKKRDEYCAKVTGEVQRYRTFCDYSNYIISKFETKRILFARNDPRLLEGLTALSLKPDVVAIGSNRPDVASGQWRNFSARGPVKNQVSWVWKDVNIVAEFKKHHEVIECPETVVMWTLQPISHLANETKVSADQHRETDSRDHDIATAVSQSSASRRGATGSHNKAAPAAPALHSTSKSGSRDSDSGAIGVPAGPVIPVPPMSTSMSVATSISEGRKRMIEEDDERDIESLKKLRLRPSKKKPIMRHDLIVDGAKYALEQLSFVPNRRHALEFLILDGTLFLAYYDRSGPVYSHPFYFAQDIYRFVLLMKRLAEMNSWEMGFLENLKEAEVPATDIVEELLSQVKKESPASPSSSTSSPGSAIGDVPVDILQAVNAIKSGEHLFTLKIDMIVVYLISEIGGRRPYGLVSRGTAVYLSYFPERRALVAVKISWPAARRLSEVEILNKARAVLRKVDADPNFKKKYGDRKLEDSLPVIIGQKDIDDLKKELSFRWATQEFYTNFDEAWNRICRAIIMELLRPLFSVTDLDQFKEAIRDIVLAHHFLFISEARILHRDISLHNLMVRYNGPHKIHGVLIDFDLASLGLPTPEGHLGRRTGTRPYMSVDLLREETPLHLERFDWESFFYVICWIASHYSGGDAVKTDAFNEWDEPDDKKLRSIKKELLVGLSEPNLDSVFTDFYKPLISWMDDIQSMFLAADQARKKFERVKAANPEDCSLVFDEETLGGHVTWEKFWEIIKD
ncbi:hypothetical protein ACEPAI_7513 [Sanghuangporus weigelae]